MHKIGESEFQKKHDPYFGILYKSCQRIDKEYFNGDIEYSLSPYFVSLLFK